MEEKFIKLHKYVEKSKGNECNICEITAIKDGKVEYEDYTASSKMKVL